jgi:hypothetical protein
MTTARLEGTRYEHAAHLDGTSVLAMLVYCVFLAGFFYALTYTPGPSAGSSSAMLVVPPELTTDETIGFR